METKRKATKYNKTVNFDEDTKEITVLDEIFKYEDGFKGATGSKFEPVSKGEYKEHTNKANVIEQILECGVPMRFYPEKVQNYYEQDGEFFIDEIVRKRAAKKCYKAMIESNEVKDFIFDTSYSELWDYLREELNLSKDEAYIFNCVGGGRCFDKDFNGNINPELSVLIREIES